MTISPALEVTLHKSFVETRKMRHATIGVEHLLLALLDNESALYILNGCSANIENLRKSLSKYIDNNNIKVEGSADVDTEPTLGFQRVIQRAIMHVQSVTDKNIQVEGANVLIAIYGEKDSYAVNLLNQQGISRLAAVEYLATGNVKPYINISGEEQLEMIVEELAPIKPVNATHVKTEKLRIFISYSHLDIDCLNRLLVHLKPLEKENLIDCWSDKKIRTGDKWKPEVMSNLENAAVAVLLISADFLASDFIINQELPPLLLSAETKGLRILPVILKPCGFLRDKSLSSIQSLNDPTNPLLGMSLIAQEHLYDKIAGEIHTEIESRKRSKHA